MSSQSKIYLFEYFDRVYDEYYSAFTIRSAHKTKKGAYNAIVKDKNEKWYNARDCGMDPEHALECGIWRIRELTVLP